MCCKTVPPKEDYICEDYISISLSVWCKEDYIICEDCMSVSVMKTIICEDYVSVTQGRLSVWCKDSTICDDCQYGVKIPVQLYSMWREKSVWCKEANITMYVKTVCQCNARKAIYNCVKTLRQDVWQSIMWRLYISMMHGKLYDFMRRLYVSKM